MMLKKTYRRILLPCIIVLSAVIAVAQVATGGKWMYKWLEPQPSVQNENDDDQRRKTGDDPWTELDQIYKVFNVPFVQYSGKIRLMNDDETTIIEDADFSCDIRGQDYRYMIDSVELIYKNGVALNIYHNEKLIVAGKEQLPNNIFRVYSNIDSLRKFASQQEATAVVVWDQNYKVIKIENIGSSDVYGYEIFYNPADYKVKKVILSVATPDDYDEGVGAEEINDMDTENEENEAPNNSDTSAIAPSIEFNLYKMEISYETFSQVISKEEFNPVKKYGSIDQKELLLNDVYSDYRVVWMDEARKTKKK